MTFKINDRVKLLEDHCPDYGKDAVCTVMAFSNSYVGILSDTDKDDRTYLYVAPEDIIHVTNVPSAAEAELRRLSRPRGSDLQPQTPAAVRSFGTGATRDLDANKLDFEGFLSPLVLRRYAEHMHKARRMPDGSMRDSDNWQLGIPVPVYMKSLFRHFFSVWELHRGIPVFETLADGTVIEKDLETELAALLFNANGMLHEILKAKRARDEQH